MGLRSEIVGKPEERNWHRMIEGTPLGMLLSICCTLRRSASEGQSAIQIIKTLKHKMIVCKMMQASGKVEDTLIEESRRVLKVSRY